jgi:hypothetical protein
MKSVNVGNKRKIIDSHAEKLPCDKHKLPNRQREDPQHRRVKFVVLAPHSKEVHLAGDFNNWDPHSLSLTRLSDGFWEAEIGLTPGSYRYKFFIDNQWVAHVPGGVQIGEVCIQDLPAAKLIANPFGSADCLLVVK